MRTTLDLTQSIHRIQIRLDDDIKVNFDSLPYVRSLDEAYLLRIDRENVLITGRTNVGVFYGIQSMLSLLESSADGLSLPLMTVVDAPRMPYRGLMLDVARCFMSKTDVMKVLEVMAMYKMNKLHLHLTDDQGWRIEVPSHPELVQVSN